MFVCPMASRRANSHASRALVAGISLAGLQQRITILLAVALVVPPAFATPGVGPWQFSAGSLPSEEDPLPTRVAEDIKHLTPVPCAASRGKQSRHGADTLTKRDRTAEETTTPRCRQIRADLEARNGFGGPLRC
jgi:hypothetical protein